MSMILNQVLHNAFNIFTARYYAERGDATVRRLSVRPSVYL